MSNRTVLQDDVHLKQNDFKPKVVVKIVHDAWGDPYIEVVEAPEWLLIEDFHDNGFTQKQTTLWPEAS